MPVFLDPHPLTDAQKNLSSAIRAQWRLFEKWLLATKSARRDDVLYKALEDEMAKSKKDTPYTYHVLLQDEYDAKKAKLKLHLDEQMVHLAQVEWERRLTKAGLNPEDWLDITTVERLAVERALGGDMESDDPTSALPPSNAVSASHPFPSTAQHPHFPQPSQSSSHHPSPFQFVDPTALREDPVHDDHFSIATAFHSDSRLREEFDELRASRLAGFTPSMSPERSSPRNVTERPFFQPQQPKPVASSSPSASASSSQQISPVDHHDSRQHAKHRVAGTGYVGPILHDDQDTKVEEADFEKFKMEIREKKIWEFHYAAAEAGVKLARRLCERSHDKQHIREILAGHDQDMQTLRRVMEDERKAIVDDEREKRQTEIRRRNALHNATANPWKTFEGMVSMTTDHDVDRAESNIRGTQRLARDTMMQQLNGIKIQSSSSTQLQHQNPDETQRSQEAWYRVKDDSPVSSVPRQLGGSGNLNTNQPQRSEDVRMPGPSKQKKKQTTRPNQDQASKNTSKFVDPSFAVSPQVQVARPVIAAESPALNEDRDNADKSTTPTIDILPTSRSRRRSLLRTPQEFWRPEGLDKQQLEASANRKIPVSTFGTVSDGANVLVSNQDKREEIWKPGRSETQRDATAEQMDVEPVAGPSSTHTVDSPAIPKIPQVSTGWGSVQGSNLGQGRPPVERSETKSAWVSTSAKSKKIQNARSLQEASTLEEEPLVVTTPISSRALEKQKQTKGEVNKHEAESNGLETAREVLSRPRRSSEPPPPSPNLFDVSAVKKQNSESAADSSQQPKSILKKSDRKGAALPPAPPKKADTIVESKKRGKAAKKANPPPKAKKVVTIEEVSDEEADPVAPIGPLGDKSTDKPDVEQPSTSSVIVEPKPSISARNFSQIFQYTAEKGSTPAEMPGPSKSTTAATLQPVEPRPTDIWIPPPDTESDDEEEDDGWNVLLRPVEERTSKAKHVRWTPSVLSNGGHSSSPLDDAMLAFGIETDSGDGGPQLSLAAAQRAKSRGRAMSFEATRGADAADRVRTLPRDVKGKGKEKVVYNVAADPLEDDLAWFANQAIENLKGMRSKAASAV